MGALTLRVIGRGGIPVAGINYEILECDNGECFGVIQRLADDASAVIVHFPDEIDTITIRASKAHWSETRTFPRSKVQFDFMTNLEVAMNPDKRLTAWSFAVGIGFMLLLLALSSVSPNPTNAQRQIWQAILSVALAAFANGILGLLEVNIEIPKVGLSLRAVGAIAIAVIVYFFVPAFA